MNSYEQELLSFMVTWAPFGGPQDEDAFPRFGLAVEQLWDRFARMVLSLESRATELEGYDTELLWRARRLLSAAPVSAA